MVTKENLHTIQYATSQNLEARIAIHQYGINPVNFWDWVWEHYHFQADDQLLEVGCGTGAFWNAATAHIPPDMHVTLTDFSSGMIVKSLQNVSPRWFRFAVADVECLPFANGVFDYLLCHFMLYHASSPETALQEMLRTLKSSGRLAIITVSDNHLARLGELVHDIDPTFERTQRLSDPFNEENGEPLLSRYFSAIEKDVYEDTLQVDNAPVVIDYLRSLFVSEPLSPGEEFYRRCAEAIEREIAELGAFRIFKRVAFYMCQSQH